MPLLRASSELEVANLALGRAKEDEIASFDDDLHRARVARRHFGTERDAVLAELDWNFASAWQQPAADVAPSMGPLKTRFPLEADTIVVREVFPSSSGSGPLGEDRWAMESGNATVAGAVIEAKILTCNETSVLVRYTKRIENVRLWDPLFIKAYVCRLAGAMATELGKSNAMAQSLLEEAESLLVAKAKRIDSHEAAPSVAGQRQLTTWLAARGGGRTRTWPGKLSGG
jgi:hypothetical protein